MSYNVGQSAISRVFTSFQERTHTVKPGETLSSIAKSHGTTVESLLAQNKHLRGFGDDRFVADVGVRDPNRGKARTSDGSRLYPGDEVFLPFSAEELKQVEDMLIATRPDASTATKGSGIWADEVDGAGFRVGDSVRMLDMKDQRLATVRSIDRVQDSKFKGTVVYRILVDVNFYCSSHEADPQTATYSGTETQIAQHLEKVDP